MHSFWKSVLDPQAGAPWQDKATQLELPFKTSPVRAPWERVNNQVPKKEEAK